MCRSVQDLARSAPLDSSPFGWYSVPLDRRAAHVPANEKRPRRKGAASSFRGDCTGPPPQEAGRGDVPSVEDLACGPPLDSSPFGWFSASLHLLTVSGEARA